MHEIEIVDDGRIRRIRIRRPERLNSLGTEHLAALADAIPGPDSPIDVVTLTGEGRAFCSGADLAGDVDAATVEEAARAVRAITGARQWVIAAVNGPAAGVGASLALACDLVLAARSAFFAMPFLPLGLVPDGGATQLVGAAGRARAARFVVGGERLGADDAERWGLVSEAVEADELAARVDAYAARLLAAPEAAAASKRLLRAADAAPLAEALDAEAVVQAHLLTTPHFADARDAFLTRSAARPADAAPPRVSAPPADATRPAVPAPPASSAAAAAPAVVEGGSATRQAGA